MAALDGEDSMAAAASHGEKWRRRNKRQRGDWRQIAATRRKKAANISGQRSACGAFSGGWRKRNVIVAITGD
jgi:hypothetical protein